MPHCHAPLGGVYKPAGDDKLAQEWIADAIPITARLKARVMLLPFFGKGALQTREEMDYVGDALRELGPVAEKAGVLLSA
jgi:hypothetical protein